MSHKVGILTLGCKVNQYESEAIGEKLQSLGYTVVSPEQFCDAYIVNSCTVTSEADRKSCQMVRRLSKLNPEAPVIVTGCTCQRSPERIMKIPGVYAVVGNGEKMKCAEIIDGYFKNGAGSSLPVCLVGALDSVPYETMSIHTFPRTRSYIKIEDGCENRCTYCAIPDARGPVRSRPAPDILEEISRLVSGGCREVVLTGIETASYGRDTGECTLGELLEQADRICDGCRIRLGSVDPSLFRPVFIEKIAGLKNIAPHFHISMQSGSSHVLALMKRRYNALQAHTALENLRAAIPGIMFTTDIIVGFPGETPEDFEQTREFIRSKRFLMTHIFPYSSRKGTPAATMPDQIPQEEKHRRAEILAKDAEEARNSLLEEYIQNNPVIPVLFETDEKGISEGHSPNFITVRIKSGCPLHGSTLNVRLLSHDGLYVYGEPVFSE